MINSFNLDSLFQFVNNLPSVKEDDLPEAFKTFLNSPALQNMLERVEEPNLCQGPRVRDEAYEHKVFEYETELLLRLCPDVLQEIPPHLDLTKPLKLDLVPRGLIIYFPSPDQEGEAEYRTIIAKDYWNFLAHYLLARDQEPGLRRGDTIIHTFLDQRNNSTFICHRNGIETLDHRINDYGAIPSSYLCPTEFPFDYWEKSLPHNENLIPFDAKTFKNQFPPPSDLHHYRNLIPLPANYRQGQIQEGKILLPLKWQGQTFFLEFKASKAKLFQEQDVIHLYYRKKQNGNIILYFEEC